MADHHLAQVNVAIPLEPLTSERLHGFMSMLDPINAVADAAPGFVWRLQTDDGDATALRPFDDERLMINMSVWESVEALSDYVYRSDHVNLMRQRRSWFVHLQQAIATCWWIPAGTLPTVVDADARLRLLRRLGPNPEAFTLQRPYGPPGQQNSLGPVEHRYCPA